MTEGHNRKFSAFALAQKAKCFGVEIDVADVRSIRPDWTEKEAAEFLDTHRQRIAEHMLLHGMRYILELTHGEGRNDA